MELEILRQIQSIANPFLDVVFIGFTMLGEQYVLVAIFCWIYWNVDKRKGMSVAYLLFTSMTFNSGFKDVLRFQRPIGQTGVRSIWLGSATGYSFPSGHTQSATSFVVAMVLKFRMEFRRRPWLWLMAIMPPLVALSRLYLGVHYPRDVLAGMLFGALIPVLCHRLEKRFRNRLGLYAATLGLLGLFLLVTRTPDYIKALSVFAGTLLGMWLEERVVGFRMPRRFSHKLRRYVVGMGILGALYFGLKLVFPGGLVFVTIRYFLVGFTGIGLCPMLFDKVGI